MQAALARPDSDHPARIQPNPPEHPEREAPETGGVRGFVQRVPGASLAADGVSEAADSHHNGSVPQPREPERPATGSARPVTASASVPVVSRAPVTPEEIPPRQGGPQARVYGHAATSAEDDQADADSQDNAWPWDRRRGADAEPAPSAGPAEKDSHPPYERNPEAVALKPQSPARATGRATASGRVKPPNPPAPAAEAQRTGPPYTEFTTDVAGRGKRPMPSDYYGEHTTDISGRGRGSDQLYALEPRPDREAPPAVEDDQARFDEIDAEVEKVPAKAETPHVRMLPVLIGVIIGAALLVGAAFGLVYLISGDSDNNGLKVNVGQCVKRDGNEAITASCSDAGAYEVVQITATQEQCTDVNQPYVVDPTSDGRTRVLCLKPRA